MGLLKYVWLTAALIVLPLACGGDDDDDKTNTPAATPTPTAGSGDLSLSSRFESTCNVCHPSCAAGTGKALAGTSLSLDAYKSKVRNGVSDASPQMPSYSDTSFYSDEDLENDYEFCKAQ